MIFDLHSHTTRSDGILSPEALMSRAKARNVSVIAVTDHDTIAGLSAARQAACELGLGFINGIEISTLWRGAGVHVVGLGVATDSPALQEAIQLLQQVRADRAVAIAAKLEKAGLGNVLPEVQRIAGDALPGRLHFARYLVKRGSVNSIQRAFKQYLGTGKVADVKYQWPDMTRAIEWIHEAGGVAVLAHPAKYDFTRSKMCRLVGEFAAAGGDAMEVVSGYQDARLTQDLARIATANGLLASCGSDFHAPDQPWQELGNFGSLPESCQPVWRRLGFEA
ncbi:PHP domain-containing protein [Cellvibrio polysaccharolyticus]|uniref:PHP domain-containing protein n=1 Tax=Cellvibrio polysaccharolyticus TaxID=2082724 RepID=UPI002E2E31A3|nr:PHP domain-containing protein [Cellvibrio polysaccharolyticus]